MNRGSKILGGVALVAILAGMVIILFTVIVLRFVAHDDVYILETRYAPNGDAVYEVYRTYDGLYQWTEHVVHDRNRYALLFHYATGAGFLMIGAVLGGWSLDRVRLSRKRRVAADDE